MKLLDGRPPIHLPPLPPSPETSPRTPTYLPGSFGIPVVWILQQCVNLQNESVIHWYACVISCSTDQMVIEYNAPLPRWLAFWVNAIKGGFQSSLELPISYKPGVCANLRSKSVIHWYLCACSHVVQIWSSLTTMHPLLRWLALWSGIARAGFQSQLEHIMCICPRCVQVCLSSRTVCLVQRLVVDQKDPVLLLRWTENLCKVILTCSFDVKCLVFDLFVVALCPVQSPLLLYFCAASHNALCKLTSGMCNQWLHFLSALGELW